MMGVIEDDAGGQRGGVRGGRWWQCGHGLVVVLGCILIGDHNSHSHTQYIVHLKL
jgi:hypothetical protein